MTTSNIIEICPRCGGKNFSVQGYGYSLNHTLSIYCNDCDIFVHTLLTHDCVSKVGLMLHELGPYAYRVDISWQYYDTLDAKEVENKISDIEKQLVLLNCEKDMLKKSIEPKTKQESQARKNFNKTTHLG